jgi:integrase
MFQHANGSKWQPSDQGRPMKEAAARAKIKPHISFHGLRHTWASLAAMNSVPLLVVAKNLGHKDTRMVEYHYRHLAHRAMSPTPFTLVRLASVRRARWCRCRVASPSAPPSERR